MPTLNLKQSVDVSKIQPEILLAILVAQSVYFEYGYDCVVTSLRDGVHMPKSFHTRDGICRAVDFRINHLPEELAANVTTTIALRLTDDYDVVQERDHIHVEYDPKPKPTTKVMA